MYDAYDVIVVGAGHAGCEAALIAARMGAKTLLATMNIFTVAQMSCNPAVGGLAKGHLVREIDALGGEMARNTDRTGIQFRMLNRSKGPAVWAPRAQCDRLDYALQMRIIIENQANLHLKQMLVDGLIVENNKITSIRLRSGNVIFAQAVILTAGTFLNGRMYTGLSSIEGGRAGEGAAKGVSNDNQSLGFRLGRHKTGTPPRIDGNTVDFDQLEIQPGDEPPPPFSYGTRELDLEQLPCYLTNTNETTHNILRTGFDRSPMFSGLVKGVGPRYCPSIEDKIFRFSDKESHQIFLEPEGRQTREMYVNGFSTSLPEEVQIRAVRAIPGLEKVEVTRLGYAVEYDFFPPDQILATLETKRIKGLYFAGQINGTSGYEEAGAQGIVAGINAVLRIRNEDPLILERSDAYVGVLIDDLVTQCPEEPYRMFTSRAEYRLLLRQDNADLRLLHFAEKYDLLPRDRLERTRKKKQLIAKLIDRLRETKVTPNEVEIILQKQNSAQTAQSESLYQLLKRPEISLSALKPFYDHVNGDTQLQAEIENQAEIEIKYEGYIRRQESMVNKFKNLEHYRIPRTINYGEVPALSMESIEKLSRYQPQSLGQASRIAGVTPSDISVLMVFLAKGNHRQKAAGHALVS
ncbi:MAG: tRNA uridine-5-carboxymethylaminomethyl(34) synthesis enzyme MnmG [bacterium]